MAINRKKQGKHGLFSVSDTQANMHKNLQFTAAEQYRMLRTNLSFAFPENEGCTIIGVTSSMRGEGKSTTSVNLSYVLAESGKKVLLVDGDLRIPTIAKKLEMEATYGLTDLLRKEVPLQIEALKSPHHDNWYVLSSGMLPPNPSELLGSKRMEDVLKELSEHFDYIVLDLPPVNLVSDALAVSKYINGMILVIRQEYTEKKELDNCIRQLRLSNVNVLGCVMNNATESRGYYKKYSYR